MEAYWKDYNPHPKGKYTNDCVKRAICAVTGWDYMEVQRGLNRTRREYLAGPHEYAANSFRAYPVYAKYFADHGWKQHNYVDNTVHFEDSRVTGKSFCESHPTGKYILHMPNHLVGCVDGVLWDIADTSDQKVTICWTIEGPEEGAE